MESVNEIIAQAQRLVAEAAQLPRHHQLGVLHERVSPGPTSAGELEPEVAANKVLNSPTRYLPKQSSVPSPPLESSPTALPSPIFASPDVRSPPLATPEIRRYPPAMTGSRSLSLGSGPFMDSAIRSSAQPTDRVDPSLLPPQLASSAYLHATLIRDLRSGFVDDFELLFKMLVLDDLTRVSPRANTLAGLDLSTCAPYAVAVLTQTEAQLLSLGPQICQLLAKQHFLQALAPNLVKSLAARAAQTSGGDRLSKKISQNQVPFREGKDSRHLFKSAEQRAIYENRERVRDAFLTNLNRVITSQNEISTYYSVDDPELNRRFRQCVQSIIPENLGWFARLFVEHLTNVSGDDREFDQGVTMWAAQNRHLQNPSSSNQQSSMDKINKLSRRLDSAVTPLNPVAAPFQPAGFVGGPGLGVSGARPMPPPRVQPLRPTAVHFPAQTDPNISSLTATTPGDWWEDLFPRPAERFFPLFLYVADSHALCANVRLCCESMLDKLSFSLSNKSAIKDDMSFSERVASCNVLAKFLGFLTYYPRFAATKVAADNQDSSGAFEFLHQESIEEANRVGPLGLDPRTVLFRAAENRCVTLVVPWIARYLASGPARDLGARESQFFRETLAILYMIRTSHAVRDAVRQKAGFGQVRVAAEIDALFQDLGMSGEKLEGEVELVSNKWPRLLTWLEMEADQSLDGMRSQYDAVCLDRVATTCVPLERLRQLLLSTTNLSGNPGFLLEKSKLRRIASKSPGAVKAMAPTGFQGSASNLLPSSLPSAMASSQEHLCRQMLAGTFLHHQEEVSRVVEFAVQSAPANIMMSATPFVQAYVREVVARASGNFDTFAEAENDALDCIMTRLFYDCRSFVADLVALSLAHKSAQFRAPIVDIAASKVELAVEKLLRRKLADLFGKERSEKEKERERAMRASRHGNKHRDD